MGEGPPQPQTPKTPASVLHETVHSGDLEIKQRDKKTLQENIKTYREEVQKWDQLRTDAFRAQQRKDLGPEQKIRLKEIEGQANKHGLAALCKSSEAEELLTGLEHPQDVKNPADIIAELEKRTLH